jgi:hypothetical protein
VTDDEIRAEIWRITLEIRSIDEKFFAEREAREQELLKFGRSKIVLKPLDPGEGRARLEKRRRLEAELEHYRDKTLFDSGGFPKAYPYQSI